MTWNNNSSNEFAFAVGDVVEQQMSLRNDIDSLNEKVDKITNEIRTRANWKNNEYEKLEEKVNNLSANIERSERANEELKEQSIVRDISETFVVYFLYQNRGDVDLKRFIEFDQVYNEFLNVNLPAFYKALERDSAISNKFNDFYGGGTIFRELRQSVAGRNSHSLVHPSEKLQNFNFDLGMYLQDIEPVIDSMSGNLKELAQRSVQALNEKVKKF